VCTATVPTSPGWNATPVGVLAEAEAAGLRFEAVRAEDAAAGDGDGTWISVLVSRAGWGLDGAPAEGYPPAVPPPATPESFAAALQLAGGAVASRTLFLDDSARNCAGAAAAGLTAIQVGTREPCEGALAALPDVRHLREVVPELWGAALAPAPAPATAKEAVEHAVAETAAIEVVA
jgi:phosphoglycolate phosphatase-like HAD superfamily hydrolase